MPADILGLPSPLSLLPNALRWWHLEAERDTCAESQPPPLFLPSSTSGPHDNTGQTTPLTPHFLTPSLPNKYLTHPSLIRILGENTPALAYMHESFLIKFT